MNLDVRLVLEFIALLGVVAGPVIAYLAAKRHSDAEVLLIDISTIKGWSEARIQFEEEIANLHNEVNAEQDKRREERKKYLAKIECLENTIRQMEKKLRDCTEDLEQ